MTLASPIRFPDTKSPATMTRRAWWLVCLNLFIPGSAQLLAGSRRLGRIGIVATLVAWAVALVAVLLSFVWRPALYSMVANMWGLTVIQIALVFYIALWIVLTVDTIRLAKLVRIRPKSRGFVAAFAVIALVLVGGVANYGVVVTGATRDAINRVFASGQAAEPIDGRYNILLLGGDAGPDRLGLRPDSISVVSIDADTGEATMIGIPRNLERAPFVEGSPLYEPFPDGYDCGDECLLSYLYTYGMDHPELYPSAPADGSNPGIEAMRDAVGGVLGLQLQYYVLIDMQGFSDLIDALGGVEIESTSRYPIGGGEDENGQPDDEVEGWIEPGVQRMDGYTALWYARARHGTSDYDRMARQREVQTAILAQFSPSNVLGKFQAIAEAGSQVVTTDVPAVTLPYFVSLAEKTRRQPIGQLELIPDNGINVVRPDFDEIHDLVQAKLNEQ
ncbi:MAG: LytR family transcriptional regulator [Microbacteriaceae bacterium]|nr:LytR family transcriptional regulator [Microbacteriaceae bacterium]